MCEILAHLPHLAFKNSDILRNITFYIQTSRVDILSAHSTPFLCSDNQIYVLDKFLEQNTYIKLPLFAALKSILAKRRIANIGCAQEV